MRRTSTEFSVVDLLGQLGKECFGMGQTETSVCVCVFYGESICCSLPL